MENLEVLLSLLATIAGLFITVVTYIIKLSKSKKIGQKMKQAKEIGEILLSYIEDAEKFSNYSGSEKREFVLTKLNKYALEHKIVLDDKDTSFQLEELIALTKKVNNQNVDSSSWLAVSRG